MHDLYYMKTCRQPNDPKQRKEYVGSILSRMTEYVVRVQKDCHNIITTPHVYGKNCYW